MSILLLLIFFRSICLYLQHIVLSVYEKLFRPKNIFLLPSSSNKCRNYRSVSSGWGGSAAYNRLVQEERARLCEQIRMRKQARKIRAK